MPPRKAASIQLNALVKSVDAAVKAATQRYDLAVDKTTLLDRWELVGRRISRDTDLATAFRFAEDITKRVNRLPGVRLEAVVTKVGPDTLVGFIERSGAVKTIR